MFDGRGNPTVEVNLLRINKTFVRVAAPSVASTKVYEAIEFRDGGSDCLGKDVLKLMELLTNVGAFKIH